MLLTVQSTTVTSLEGNWTRCGATMRRVSARDLPRDQGMARALNQSNSQVVLERSVPDAEDCHQPGPGLQLVQIVLPTIMSASLADAVDYRGFQTERVLISGLQLVPIVLPTIICASVIDAVHIPRSPTERGLTPTSAVE